MPRWLVPVLVVIFALTTAWAGYNVVHVASASRTPGPPGPPLDYGGSGVYGYVASLLPNDLFNSTTVSGSNVTLFVSITKTINVTFLDTVSMSASAPATFADQFVVTLATPAWTKTLEETDRHNSSTGTFGFTFVDRYLLNVSTIESLVRTIDNELNYSAPSFTVSFAASVVGSVVWGTSAAPVVLSPILNLTFEGSLIVPKGSTATAAGSLTDPSSSTDPAGGNAMVVADAELAASATALAISLWLLFLEYRRPSTSLPPLEKLIEPYEEVIARTTRVPGGLMVLPVERWEDLVKVADTLGRPILRPVATPADPVGSEFYVYDGSAAYVYRYPRSAEPTRGKSRTAAVRAAPEPSPGVSGPSGTATSPASLADARRAWAGRRRTLNRRITEQLESQLRRLRSAKLDPPERWYAFSLVTQTVRTVSTADPEQAQAAVDDLRQAMDRLLNDGGRSS